MSTNSNMNQPTSTSPGLTLIPMSPAASNDRYDSSLDGSSGEKNPATGESYTKNYDTLKPAQSQPPAAGPAGGHDDGANEYEELFVEARDTYEEPADTYEKLHDNDAYKDERQQPSAPAADDDYLTVDVDADDLSQHSK